MPSAPCTSTEGAGRPSPGPRGDTISRAIGKSKRTADRRSESLAQLATAHGSSRSGGQPATPAGGGSGRGARGRAGVRGRRRAPSTRRGPRRAPWPAWRGWWPRRAARDAAAHVRRLSDHVARRLERLTFGERRALLEALVDRIWVDGRNRITIEGMISAPAAGGVTGAEPGAPDGGAPGGAAPGSRQSDWVTALRCTVGQSARHAAPGDPPDAGLPAPLRVPFTLEVNPPSPSSPASAPAPPAAPRGPDRQSSPTSRCPSTAPRGRRAAARRPRGAP